MNNLPDKFTEFLRLVVMAQDAGVPVAEHMQAARITLSTIDRIMVEADLERHRMANEGLPVYTRDGEAGLVIGLGDKPYKQPFNVCETCPSPVDCNDRKSCAERY